MNRPIGIFGGTFDPVHFGHLRPALEVCKQLNLEQVRLIPSKVPVHRAQPVAPLEQRILWLQQVTEAVPQFVVDLREVERETPSWMVVTLESLKKEFPDHPLVLILGMDAFLQLESWHRWQALLDSAHLLVTHRPGFVRPERGIFSDWLLQRETEQITLLHQRVEKGEGKVLFLSVTQLEISASGIRSQIVAGGTPLFLLPDIIHNFVIDCYST
ncbi:MAG: nicotinate-nucleotide adenylyltransferase [Gammaproteobacteria bacterium]|nr:nicotinate-nucleotide adenylyltransferase [Gammaproteobacteria bacterium]